MPAKLFVAAVSVFWLGGCVHVPPSGRAAVRLERYFSTPHELRPSIRDAMLKGHVVEGMDAEQVRVVLGDPVRSTRFGHGGDVIDVWLFRGYRFHQERFPGKGSTLYRLVLVNGVLAIVEPL
jgi:hypothetical protein